MKASYVVVLGVLLGLALGAGVTWARFGDAPPLRLPVSGSGSEAAAAGDQPKLQIDERFFDFGVLERDLEARHDFRVTNIGKRPLTLEAGGTTCTKCTIAEVGKSTLEPGESTTVTVAYKPGDKAVFRQVAWIKTNDPDQQRVELNISGSVTTRYEVVPAQVVLSKVSAHETRQAEVKIWAFFSDAVEITSHEFSDPDTASFYEFKSSAIAADQVAEQKAKSGCRVELTLKPGLPLGPFRQTIRLQFRMSGTSDTPTVEVPIMGTIDSDISLVGPGWNSDAERLAMGTVKSDKGVSRQLLMLVRGEHRHGVTVKPVDLDPAWLKVTVGEPSELPSGAVTQIPLTIEIPPGMQPVNRLGTEQGKFAEITLETTHPEVKQIRMHLKFVIVP
jgi:hypothetical protein